jgi:hypothetical protein
MTQITTLPFDAAKSLSTNEAQIAALLDAYESKHAGVIDSMIEHVRVARERAAASGILTEGGDAKQAPGESLSSPTGNAGDAQTSSSRDSNGDSNPMKANQ